MFVLFLKSMIHNSPRNITVAKAETREELEAVLIRESVPPYDDIIIQHDGTDKPYKKVFRRGGPLEWYYAARGNAVYNDEGDSEGIVDSVYLGFPEEEHLVAVFGQSAVTEARKHLEAGPRKARYPADPQACTVRACLLEVLGKHAAVENVYTIEELYNKRGI